MIHGNFMEIVNAYHCFRKSFFLCHINIALNKNIHLFMKNQKINIRMAFHSIAIFLCNIQKDVEFNCDSDLSETVCNALCEELGITAMASVLFALRIRGKDYYLPSCRHVQPNMEYELRVRFHTSDLEKFVITDAKAFDYYYHQVKWDFVNNKIPKFLYSNDYLTQMIELAVISMFTEMIENHNPIDELVDRFLEFIPIKYNKNYLEKIQLAISENVEILMNIDLYNQ